ncbi:MAG: DUF4255 domain-containing protein [Caldilineaceae bacterium]
MSALAIAGVTAVLKNLTQNFFTNATITTSLGATPEVSAVAPDLAETLHDNVDAVNWFMQRTALNSGLSNAFYPARDSQGGRIQQAPLALDLYYLLSAYGNGDMHAEILLGHVIQLFHENPILDRAAITAALASATGTDGTIITLLNSANIPDRLDHLKLSIHHPDDEWLSQLWGALNAHYRPSVIVQVSMILIESDISVQPGLPVQRYAVEAMPLSLPTIDRVEPAGNPAGQIAFGDAVVIRGNNLAAEVTRVQVGDQELSESDLTTVQRARIEIPGSALTGLRAGVNAVQVLHDLPLGVPAVPHRGFQSNVVPMILHPTISAITPTLAADVDGNLAGQIQVTIQPPVRRGQRVNLLLNRATAVATPSLPRGYSFNAPPVTTDGPVTSFTIDVVGVVPVIILCVRK